MTKNWHARWYWATGAARNIALGVSAGTSLLLKANVAGLPASLSWVATLTNWVKGWAWLLVPVSLLVAWLAFKVRRWLGDPEVIQVVHDLLTEYRNKIVSDRGRGLEHHHRVTLFRHREWAFVRRRWPWQGWLIPEIRSGETTRNPSCRFKASSDSPDEAEGIAGLAWVSDKDVEVSSLPDVSFPNASDEAVATYARITKLSPAEIRKMKPHARSFHAFKVYVSTKRWGVIVIDSKSASLKRDKVNAGYRQMIPSLSVLLKRI